MEVYLTSSETESSLDHILYVFNKKTTALTKPLPRSCNKTYKNANGGGGKKKKKNLLMHTEFVEEETSYLEAVSQGQKFFWTLLLTKCLIIPYVKLYFSILVEKISK